MASPSDVENASVGVLTCGSMGWSATGIRTLSEMTALVISMIYSFQLT